MRTVAELREVAATINNEALALVEEFADAGDPASALAMRVCNLADVVADLALHVVDAEQRVGILECVVEDTDGPEALAPAPHEHRWITDDDGCVHACVCGAPWEPAAPALGPPPPEWVSRAIDDLGLDISTRVAVDNLLYNRKREAGADHRAAYDVPHTVGELVACCVEDLRRGRNIGPKKIAKVQSALAKHGMQLATKETEIAAARALASTAADLLDLLEHLPALSDDAFTVTWIAARDKAVAKARGR